MFDDRIINSFFFSLKEESADNRHCYSVLLRLLFDLEGACFMGHLGFILFLRKGLMCPRLVSNCIADSPPPSFEVLGSRTYTPHPAYLNTKGRLHAKHCLGS